jgi:hypothetical protein
VAVYSNLIQSSPLPGSRNCSSGNSFLNMTPHKQPKGKINKLHFIETEEAFASKDIIEM